MLLAWTMDMNMFNCLIFLIVIRQYHIVNNFSFHFFYQLHSSFLGGVKSMQIVVVYSDAFSKPPVVIDR